MATIAQIIRDESIESLKQIANNLNHIRLNSISQLAQANDQYSERLDTGTEEDE